MTLSDLLNLDFDEQPLKQITRPREPTPDTVTKVNGLSPVHSKCHFVDFVRMMATQEESDRLLADIPKYVSILV